MKSVRQPNDNPFYRFFSNSARMQVITAYLKFLFHLDKDFDTMLVTHTDATLHHLLSRNM